ncbi:HTH-type transcriptional regulator VirS [Zhongshania aliphaticivorans]|uniref:HTH-type transcriptional regulator VirS n=1 Tax=Zhongshania aliphaticivorans TaxID=1470434 RepID=A0A5S9MY17_9GAMM|nr:AraC family transcriptional regulator [Zhongshania aliphaticivorans]CAA0082244.1 HTH-type transcriptional regulator VirS [Zhongshania aliphaticivorans]CAA0084479.1 HTH-type transcriptional regulator VirS [Zhongshania aliphaticivorans]
MRPLIRTSAISGYKELVRELGAEPEPLLLQFNIDPDRLDDLNYLIFFHSLMQLLEASAEKLQCPDFGLRLSEKQNMETLGPIAIMARTSSTVGDALFCIARYISHHSPAITLGLDDTSAPQFPRMILDINVSDFPYRHQTVEMCIGLMANIHAILTENRKKPEAVLFRHSRALDLKTYKRHFGCPVLFNQECNALVLTPEQFDFPIRTADAFQRDVIANYVIKKSGSSPLSFIEQTNFIISRLLPTQCCNIKTVANELFMHQRTLQRRLKEEGHIFADMVDNIRKQDAQNFLAERRMPMAQIAGILGYQEQSSFNRAVKRWFGVTPNTYRKSLYKPAK